MMFELRLAKVPYRPRIDSNFAGCVYVVLWVLLTDEGWIFYNFFQGTVVRFALRSSAVG